MKKQIKILYIVSTLKNTGPTNQLYEIVAHLNKNRYKTEILTLSPETQDSQKDRFIKAGIKVQSLEMKRTQFALRGRGQLLKKIKVIQPDIIHTSGLRADCEVCHLKEYSERHCMTIRNYIFEDYPDVYGQNMGRILAKKHLKAIKECRYPVTCSHSLKDIYMVKLGISTETIQNSVECKKYKRKNDSLKDKVVFVMSGALIERKDPFTAIKAFHDAELNKKAQLIVLGDGPLLKRCSTFAQDNILFTGKVWNIAEYLKKADYAISSSLSEGLPNSILEAGAAGAGLLLSDIPQHRELIEDLEPACYNLFPVKKVEKISKLIDQSIINARTINHEVISNYFKKKFDSEVMARHYENLYESMLKNKLQEESSEKSVTY